MSRESEEEGEKQFWEQFAPDMSSEPDVFTPEEIARLNAKLEADFLDIRTNSSSGLLRGDELK